MAYSMAAKIKRCEPVLLTGLMPKPTSTTELSLPMRLLYSAVFSDVPKRILAKSLGKLACKNSSNLAASGEPGMYSIPA